MILQAHLSQKLYNSSLIEKEYIDRTVLNAWQDDNTYKAIKKKGKKKIVFKGSYTSVCLALPALSAINDGYEAYILTDACCGIIREVHDMALQRLIQAGAKPITSLQYMLEIQRGWANKETYDEVMKLIKRFGGAYGIGVQYVEEMIKK